MDVQNYISHSWNVTLEEAEQIQRRLSQKVILRDDFGKLDKILGVGVVFSRDQDEVFVGGVNLSFPKMEILNTTSHKQKVNFPYTPGFFAFTAGSAILYAIEKMGKPDLIMFPGRGIAHPRGLGLASHLGVLLDVPSIACSKTPLWRDYPELSSKKGAYVFIERENKELIGAAVRTREDAKPIFVTPGHKVSIQTAVKIVLKCSPKYRLPEPLRQAQILAKKIAENR